MPGFFLLEGFVKYTGEGRRRREKGEGKREKGEGRRERGEGKREKGEGRGERGEGKGSSRPSAVGASGGICCLMEADPSTSRPCGPLRSG